MKKGKIKKIQILIEYDDNDEINNKDYDVNRNVVNSWKWLDETNDSDDTIKFNIVLIIFMQVI